MPDTKQLHVKPLWRCFLCHDDLPDKGDIVEDEDDQDYDAIPDWQLSLVSLLPRQNEDGSSRAVLRAAEDLRHDKFLGWFGVRFALHRRDGPGRPVKFCSDTRKANGGAAMFCEQCPVDHRPLFLAHKCCWKVVNRPELLPSPRLLRLAQHTQPILPKLHDGSQAPRLSRQTQLELLGAKTPLGELLDKAARRLPRELQCIILDYLDGSLFASLLKASTVAPSLLGRLGCASDSEPVEPKTVVLAPEGPITSLYAESAYILGQSYLTGIGFNRTRGVSSVSATDSPVRAVQYALGEFGLRAVRILYADGARSAWLGDPSSCWFGTARGSKLKRLCALSDDIRLIRVWFEGHADPHDTKQTPRHILWDHPDQLPSQPRYKLLTTSRGQPKVPYYPECRLCHYIPLVYGSEYASGLTFYAENVRCDPNLRGIVCHGPSTRLLGRRSGLPMHFSLAPGEYLNSLWMSVMGSTTIYRSQYLLSVTTNRGRSQHFGAFIATQAPNRLRPSPESIYNWERVNTGRPSKITGIFLDALTYWPQQCLFDLGVVEDYGVDQSATPKAPPLLAELLERPHSSRSLSDAGYLHLTVASLDDIVGLEVRRDGRWCVGLRLLHSNGPAEALGRWDPSDAAPISRIYDAATDGPLLGLMFQLERPAPRTTRVRGIRASTQTSAHRLAESSERLAYFVCQGDGRRLAWWFATDYDEVAHYEPTNQRHIAKSARTFPLISLH